MIFQRDDWLSNTKQEATVIERLSLSLMRHNSHYSLLLLQLLSRAACQLYME